jgi:adenosylhomocysteinase
MNKINTVSPASDAQQRLERAARDMPVLAAIARRSSADAPLKGHRIALCGHITEATSIQVRTLSSLGADIAWCASSTSTTDDAICALMGNEVSVISGARGMSDDDLHAGVRRVLAYWPDGPTLILDEGARLIAQLHLDNASGAQVRIAAEKTPEGIKVIEDLGKGLKMPVLMSDMSIGKRLVDNPHGTSQSLLQTIVNVSQGLIAGKTLLVCGFGRVGAGVAQKARGFGARVLVAEIRPTRALMATLSGFETLPLDEALPQAEIVLTVTGQPGVIAGSRFARLRNGAVLVNGGHLPLEIDVLALTEASENAPYAFGLTQHRFEDGRTVYLMAGGNIANLSVGSGNPNGVMDTTFSSQVLGLLSAADGTLDPGLYPLPEESEREVARLIAESLGIDTSDLDLRTEAYA